jgi:hypothetical protein
VFYRPEEVELAFERYAQGFGSCTRSGSDPSSIEEAAKAIGKLEEIDETLNEAQYDLINSIGFITWVRDAARSLIAELAAE